MEYGEEAGRTEFLFRPADLEQVVRSLQALLHLYVVLCDDAVEGAVDRPYSLHITVVLDGAQHPCTQWGQVVVDEGLVVRVDSSQRFLGFHNVGFC